MKNYSAKSCIVCGRKFAPKSGGQLCCSRKCKDIYRAEYKIITHRGKGYAADEIDTEWHRQAPPMLRDIIQVRETLKDFKIETEIPKFATYMELNNWKNKTIKTALLRA